MKMLRLKKGVSLNGVQPEMSVGLSIVVNTYHRLGHDCTVTSCTDGVHSSGSLHYVGLAMDFRTRDVPEGKRSQLRGAVASSLGDDFDVILEKTHLHVEFDPKQ
jgi:hypothetical protein